MITRRGAGCPRAALSLIEVLVVLGIISILVALLIPAVMRVRTSALRTQSFNNLRQIGIATANYGADRHGELPSLAPQSGGTANSTFVALLPYLEQKALYAFIKDASVGASIPHRCPPVYTNPLDPSVGVYPAIVVGGYHNTSYVCNAQVFLGRPNFRSTFPDGTSNTLLFAEQYGWNCRGTMFVYTHSWVTPRWLEGGDPFGNLAGQGRATFGDLESGDFHSITAGKTFQTAPSLRDCDPRMPNASTTAGLQVNLADGSARLLSPGISPAMFWASLTPDGGEIVSLD